MTRAIAAAEAVEHRTKKVIDPAKRKRSTATRRNIITLSTAPTTDPTSTDDVDAEQTDSFFEAFYIDTPVEFLAIWLEEHWLLIGTE